MKWKYFLIDGEKFYSPKDIFDRFKKSMEVAEEWYMKLKDDHVIINFQESSSDFNSARRNLFFINTNLPETKKFFTATCDLNIKIKKEPDFGIEFERSTFIIFANGVIYDIYIPPSIVSKLPMTNDLHECVMEAYKIEYIHDDKMMRYGKQIESRMESRHCRGTFGLHYLKLTDSVDFYSAKYQTRFQ
jgi:hypothetical protein